MLFGAIEESLQYSTFIRDLYEGELIGFVKCLSCSKESVRHEKFLDLMLTVRNQIDNIYNDSMEIALARYFSPETLSGTEQYFCQNCQKKVSF